MTQAIFNGIPKCEIIVITIINRFGDGGDDKQKKNEAVICNDNCFVCV